ncbi:MAG: hypothetical protein IPH31_05875 [Lewinellaceae bacterium]|nr:hypothetical protein [Lewinellaceae bacterium]
MQIPSFLQKFGRDIVYLSIIIGMAGWIWVDERREQAWNDLLSNDMKTFEELVSRSNQNKQREIEKTFYAYPDKDNKRYCNRIGLAYNETQAFKKNLRQILDESGNSNPVNQTGSISNLDTLNLSARKLCDSLILYVGNDADAVTKIRSLLVQDSTTTFWEIAEKSKAHQSGILLRLMNLRTDAAYFEILNFLGRKVQSACGIGNATLPVVISERPAISIGEVFNAEVFLAQFQTNASNLKIKVNGNLLPVIEGIAHHSQRYTTPGEKRYTVLI